MDLVKFASSYRPDFEKICCVQRRVPYEPKGIGNVEGLYWWSAIAHYRPDVVLESGICRGRSTHVVAEACRHYGVPHHFAFEKKSKYQKYIKDKLSGYPLHYEVRDSVEGFRWVRGLHPSAKVVMIVDGPKSGDPLRQVIEIAASFPGIQALLAHDANPTSPMREIFGERCRALLPNFSTQFIDAKAADGPFRPLEKYLAVDEKTHPGAYRDFVINKPWLHIGLCLKLDLVSVKPDVDELVLSQQQPL